MNDFLNKISSYNLFNYLFSGIVFVILSEQFTAYSFVQEDIVMGLFLYYFIGLVISRIGSLLIEPILKKTSFVKFADYSDFVRAAKTDDTLEVLSEVSNMYRSLASIFLTLIFLKIYQLWTTSWDWLAYNQTYILIIFLFLMFVFAYRKQSQYITNRIKANLKKYD